LKIDPAAREPGVEAATGTPPISAGATTAGKREVDREAMARLGPRRRPIHGGVASTATKKAGLRARRSRD
jgi:hypothetical protein